MLSSERINELYLQFGDAFPYRNFELAAKAYYLMVTKRYTLSKAVKELTGSTIGFRITDVASAGQYLFKKIGNRYVPLGYLATVTANIHGGGTLVFSLWFPFYYTDFYPVLRDVSRFISSLAGSFSYTIRVSPFVNHGRFRLQQDSIIYEGTFKYQWSDSLCYFEIEIEKNCRTGRVIKRNSVMVSTCTFIGPLVPPTIPICIIIPPARFVREPWMLSEEDIKRTYNQLIYMLFPRNYDLFRVAILAYQLMVERDYSFYASTNYMARLAGIPSSTIRTFMIRSKLVVPAYPPRYPNRKYEPNGYDVSYSIYTEESEGKKSKGTALELRFTIWQPFYTQIPFSNAMTVVEVLFNSLGSAGISAESVVLGIIRSFGGTSIEDIEDILAMPLQSIVRRFAVFRNRDKYTITLIKRKTGNAWRYDGIMRYQWEQNTICYLFIETLRLCAKLRERAWIPYAGMESIITDRGFAGCNWVFDERLRRSINELNFNNVCS